MRQCVLIAILLVPWGSGGCRGDGPATVSTADSSQRYPYDEVKRRLVRLVPGASRIEVLVALGSPAVEGRETWIYRPRRSGLLLPAEQLEVRFRDGRYVAHRFAPIVLGEALP